MRISLALGPGFDLARLTGNGRIVTGDARSVSVGRYAKAALERLPTAKVIFEVQRFAFVPP